MQGQTLYIGEVCMILFSCDYVEIKEKVNQPSVHVTVKCGIDSCSDEVPT